MTTVERAVKSEGLASPRLSLESVSKNFFGVPALVGVDLQLRAGEVHALLGGNGSGKSTLVKILAGVCLADSGRVVTPQGTVDVAHYGPAAARELGLRFVHQDLGLFPGLSVAENLTLDHQYPTRALGRIAWRRLRDESEQLCGLVGLRVPVTTPVGALRPAQRTLVAMARALRDGKQDDVVLVLDEPTASLPERESELVLDAAASRAAAGQAVVLITHRLGEVRAIADRLTVLRDGLVVGSGATRAMAHEQIVAMLSGEASSPSTTDGIPARTVGSAVVVASGLSSGAVRDVSLTVSAGEIVGLAGLLGSGRSQLLRTIFGVQPHRGSLLINGRQLGQRRGGPRAGIPEAVSAGVALVPEDRAADAAFPELSVRDNVMATRLGAFRSRGVVRRELERRYVNSLITDFRIKANSVEQSLVSLSGGNQQKAILARWMQTSPRVLLLDEPTQGVDVVARAEIYALIRAAAAKGCCVLVASNDAEELATLCDRVLIMQTGHLTSELTGADLTASWISNCIHQNDQVWADVPHDDIEAVFASSAEVDAS